MQTWFFLLLLRVGIARVGLNRQGTGGGRDEQLQEGENGGCTETSHQIVIAAGKLYLRYLICPSTISIWGSSLPRVHLCSPWRLLGAWRGRKWTRLCTCTSGVPAPLHCWGCSRPAENAGDQFTKGFHNYWSSSGMIAACRKDRECNTIRKNNFWWQQAC